jgi:RNA polymerase sigma-70 factor, ECF subfamily
MDGRCADQEQFLQATLRHADVLHALARRLAPRPEDAADIVQETYLRAYAAWTRQPPQDTGAWLATICLNVGRDQLRRHARHQAAVTMSPLPDLASELDTERQVLERESTDRIHALLMTLPEPQRIAITLMDVCGFTAQQVAAITDAPRGTVLARVHRGRKRLAASLIESDRASTPRDGDA